MHGGRCLTGLDCWDELGSGEKKQMKTALIVGITGQDGSYLARHLLSKGYRVVGTSRDPQGSPLGNLRRLGIAESVRMLSLVPDDFHSVLLAVSKAQSQEVYYLASQSSVGLAF